MPAKVSHLFSQASVWKPKSSAAQVGACILISKLITPNALVQPHVLSYLSQQHVMERGSKIWNVNTRAEKMKEHWEELVEALLPQRWQWKKALVKLWWFLWNLIWKREGILGILNTGVSRKNWFVFLFWKVFCPHFKKLFFTITQNINVAVRFTKNFLEHRFLNIRPTPFETGH